jgi:hypothetical protein
VHNRSMRTKGAGSGPRLTTSEAGHGFGGRRYAQNLTWIVSARLLSVYAAVTSKGRNKRGPSERRGRFPRDARKAVADWGFATALTHTYTTGHRFPRQLLHTRERYPRQAYVSPLANFHMMAIH